MKSIADCLPETFDTLGLTERLKQNSLSYYWNQIVGDTVGANCFVVSVEPPLLSIGVISSPWMQQLLMIKPVIIKKINDFYGKEIITDIRLQMRNGKIKRKQLNFAEGDVKKKNRDEEYINLDHIVLSPEEAEHFRNTVKQVKSQKLREILLKGGIGSAKKKKFLLEEGYKECPSCGSMIEKNEHHCLRCIYRMERKRIGFLKRSFYKKPYGNYDDICELFSCTQAEFSEAKKEMIYRYLNIIYLGGDTEYDRYMAAMLITGKSKDQLTEDFVIHMADKYRKKSFSK